jgi:hypothetical protein
LDDKVLKPIIKSLYYPECPYEFSVLWVDILWNIYEQFLWKTIIKSGKTIKTEFKPEIKKSGWVFYTPQYIVDYIVQNTVWKLLKKKTPKEALKLKIVDPACWSWAFLIGAYNFILEWFLKQMPKNYKNTLWKSIFEETSQLVVLIFKANTQREERKQHLHTAREKAELIHVLLRLMRDLHCISLEEFISLQPHMATIGKQLTWWHRHS